MSMLLALPALMLLQEQSFFFSVVYFAHYHKIFTCWVDTDYCDMLYLLVGIPASSTVNMDMINIYYTIRERKMLQYIASISFPCAVISAFLFIFGTRSTFNVCYPLKCVFASNPFSIMKIGTVYLSMFCICYMYTLDQPSDTRTKRLTLTAEIERNLTPMKYLKHQKRKTFDANEKKSPQGLQSTEQTIDIFQAEEQQDQARLKRKAGKENLDNLYSSLAIRKVNVNLDFLEFTRRANLTQIATSFALSDGKGLVAHVMTLGSSGNHYTIPSLDQDRVYRGEIKLLTDKAEVKNFIRKQSNKKNAEEFELTTPFIVEDDDIKRIVETRRILEKRQKKHSQTIKVNYIDIKLSFTKVEKLGYTIDVSRYYSEANNSISTAPEQTIELLPPVKEVVLTHQQPHQLLRVSLRKVHENEEDGDIFFRTLQTVNIFTGNTYPMAMANFSRAFDARSLDELRRNVIQDNATRLSQLKNIPTVKCYIDDDIFHGYACQNSDSCIPLNWVCDGERDCPSDDDERGCNDDYVGYENEYFSYRGVCGKYGFRCRARGEYVCLPNSWLCDGRTDCSEGWDENFSNCFELYKQLRPGYTHRRNVYQTKSCGHNYFKCWNGRDCAALRDVCDGNEDCSDGSDERICENWSQFCDGVNEFRCYKSSRPRSSYYNRSCIPRSWMCDGRKDCPNGEEESSRVCDDYDKFSFSSSILNPFGIGLEISTRIKDEKQTAS